MGELRVHDGVLSKECGHWRTFEPPDVRQSLLGFHYESTMFHSRSESAIGMMEVATRWRNSVLRGGKARGEGSGLRVGYCGRKPVKRFGKWTAEFQWENPVASTTLTEVNS